MELPRVGLASRIAVIVYVDVDMSDDRLVQEGQAGRDRVALDRLRHAWERGGCLVPSQKPSTLYNL